VSKVSVNAPRSVVWLTVGLVVADVAIAVTGPLWLYLAVSAGALVAIMVALVRWSRRIRPRLRAGRGPGEPRPWVEVVWPRWTRRVAAVWIVLMAASVVVLLVLLVVATLVRRFG
jgi:hypothetical protein